GEIKHKKDCEKFIAEQAIKGEK
ncbi:hypothetical protein LCGC14_3117440, partial [marine sediment metagenome]